MRLDVNGAAELGLLGKVKVMLNGLPVNDCICADEEAGEVVVYNMKALESGMDEIPTETMRGDVQIIIGERDDGAGK